MWKLGAWCISVCTKASVIFTNEMNPTNDNLWIVCFDCSGSQRQRSARVLMPPPRSLPPSRARSSEKRALSTSDTNSSSSGPSTSKKTWRPQSHVHSGGDNSNISSNSDTQKPRRKRKHRKKKKQVMFYISAYKFYIFTRTVNLHVKYAFFTAFVWQQLPQIVITTPRPHFNCSYLAHYWRNYLHSSLILPLLNLSVFETYFT